ncbi:HesB/YadR/YfhF family protein [Bacillus sp. B1-b2]|uniref:HesB/YadR/YfhF family protein n=1 Tax=Bacillus sp. B1-b2 TaxID=2653201 RepID=UPI0012627D3F|nr:HesB/YadR/YfhF family protein [Bacillus sp. B1-b2]KAB7672630.1 HesB/YadR/YfhF family protein [Bacillus sp. B1-b2]
MIIKVSSDAIDWFKEEVGLSEGKAVRFYPQIYGTSPIQEGFALAFTIEDKPSEVTIYIEAEGITLFVEETDLWFFNGHDLFVEYNDVIDELEYKYEKSE